jgi:hypothetical protein
MFIFPLIHFAVALRNCSTDTMCSDQYPLRPVACALEDNLQQVQQDLHTPRDQPNISYRTIALSEFKAILFLPCSEHHIRSPGKTYSGDPKCVRSPFPFLELDIVSPGDIREQRLDFIDRKESSRANIKW